MTRYRSRSFVVEAFRWEPDVEIPEWVRPFVLAEIGDMLVVAEPNGDRQVHPGDYVLRGPDMVLVVVQSAFDNAFEPIALAHKTTESA